MRLGSLALLLTLAAFAGPVCALNNLRIEAQSVKAPSGEISKLVAQLKSGEGALSIASDRVVRPDRTLANIKLECAALTLTKNDVVCEKGGVALGSLSANWSGSISPAKQSATVLLESQGDKARATVEWSKAISAAVVLERFVIKRLAPLVPKSLPQLQDGTLNGRANLMLDGERVTSTFDVTLANGKFSDAASLQAGEKIELKLTGTASGNWPAGVTIDAVLDAKQGEVFWDPIYVAVPGYQVTAKGVLTPGRFVASSLATVIPKVGTLSAAADIAFDPFEVKQLSASTIALDLKSAYDAFVKPAFAQTLAGELSAEGKLDIGIAVTAGKTQRLYLKAQNVAVTDPRNRFTFTGLNADIPWVRGEATGAQLSWSDAKFVGIPLGATNIPLALAPRFIEARKFEIPVLDGALAIDRVALDHEDDGWVSVLAGRVRPVSMEKLTTALNFPVMQGTLAAELPTIRYDGGRLSVNGDMIINVFAGEVRASQLELLDTLGRAPRFKGSFTARNLDLGLVTQTFKFGRMEGRIDADLKDLELANWRPVHVDARVESSPGDYRKRISQQAVQNIGALGGAGAAVAIQRSVLRFFEEFGYDKLGITCKLRGNICEMGGVEEGPSGYILVKGGGVPQITVTGYNRRVGWNELINRVKGAIESNEKPIIK